MPASRYRPIYDMALAKAAAVRGRRRRSKRVLAIGDSVRTDLQGRAGCGHRLPVRDRRHPRRGARRARTDPTPRRSTAMLRATPAPAGASGDAARWCGEQPGGSPAVVSAGPVKTASILVFSVCALNGLTM